LSNLKTFDSVIGKKIFFFLVLLISAIYSYSQDSYEIRGCIENMTYPKIYLTSLNGDLVKDIDSTEVENGCFVFKLKSDLAPGIYSIVLNKKNKAFIRLVFNNENISFTANLQQLLSSINFNSSFENQLFYNYNKKVSRLTQKSDALTKAKSFYKKGEPFELTLQSEIEILNNQMIQEADEIIKSNPTTLYAKILSTQKILKAPQDLEKNKQVVFLQQHYLDFVDFSCEALVHTDLLPNIIRNYISLFENKSLSYDEQEKKYEDAVKNLLSKKEISSSMNNFLTKELIDYFRFGNYDIIEAYINEQFVQSKICQSDKQYTDVSTRIEKIRRVSVGKQAPEIFFDYDSFKKLHLSDIKSEFTLLVFWATTCPHCTKMLPELKKFYESKYNGSLSIVAISLDTNESKLNSFLETGKYPWINYSDFKGWKSPIAEDYNISGTPTFFLLDKSKKIISKPLDIDELNYAFQSIEL
jgi:thiol-disulfide isomerase/thioredoxin